ncbi:MAG: decaprenyl-phosphate phosphoribosyltransferase [Propioniciclava sp.]
MTDLAPIHHSPRLPAVVRAMRPRQWVKNALVFTAPLAAGLILDVQVIGQTVLAFVAFSLVSASIYLINDSRDVEADRLHPTKRLRPIAAGELSIRTALILAAITLIASLAVGWFTAPALAATLAVYWVAQVAYSLFWKNEPIIDLAMVALGFLLRAIAGGVASSIPLSPWFLLVASFGSLFMVAGKRYSELVQLGSNSGTRASLARYTPGYLRFVWAMACGAVVMSYALWAVDQVARPGASPLLSLDAATWNAISIAPFTLAVLRYAYVIDAGQAGEPEEVVLGDRVLQLLGLVWLLPVALALFA